MGTSVREAACKRGSNESTYALVVFLAILNTQTSNINAAESLQPRKKIVQTCMFILLRRNIPLGVICQAIKLLTRLCQNSTTTNPFY